MKDGTVLYVIRHARSVWNGTHRVSGQLDPELSPEGYEQAQSIARFFADRQLDAIFTSDLLRAIETARPVADQKGLTVHQSPALRELHFGSLQGRYRDARDPEALALWEERARSKDTFRAPGGETMAELTTRVVSCMSEIRRESRGRPALIVGHRSTNRVILGSLMQWPQDVWWTLRLRSRWIYEIRLNETPTLTSFRLAAAPPYRSAEGLET
jgi:broad specificity phosphatase PhoE